MTDPVGGNEEGEWGTGDESGWPVTLRGVTESVVTTLGPNGRWNAAALGLHAGDPVTARTWGRTRTRRNFEREGEGHVQFLADPVVFVESALGIYEVDEPVLAVADAWVEVSVERVDAGETDGTAWVEWALTPEAAAVRETRVPTIERGFNAVIEATVAASRLDVPAYDDDRLYARLGYFADVVDTCGGERERRAMDRLAALADCDLEALASASRNEPL